MPVRFCSAWILLRVHHTIDRAARPAAGAMGIQPRHADHDRRPNCRRPAHIAVVSELLVSTLDDAHLFHLARDHERHLVGRAVARIDRDANTSKGNLWEQSDGDVIG
jgi:hypothetical protein